MIRYGRIIPYDSITLYDDNEKPCREIIGPADKGKFLKRSDVEEWVGTQRRLYAENTPEMLAVQGVAYALGIDLGDLE